MESVLRAVSQYYSFRGVLKQRCQLWKMQCHILILLFMGGISAPLIACEQRADQTITIAVSVSIPPYIDRKTQGGIEAQLIRAALAEECYKLKLKLLKGSGLKNNFLAGRVDGVLINRAPKKTAPWLKKGFASNDIIAYHNYAITLKESGFKLEDIQTLGKLNTVAFFNASKLLGNTFSEAVSKSELYKEVQEQDDQVLALYKGMADVVIADPLIFRYFQNEIKQSHGIFKEVVFHDLFPLSPRYLVFSRQEDRDRFNRGLEKINANGLFDKIYQTAINQDLSYSRFH